MNMLTSISTQTFLCFQENAQDSYRTFAIQIAKILDFNEKTKGLSFTTSP